MSTTDGGPRNRETSTYVHERFHEFTCLHCGEKYITNGSTCPHCGGFGKSGQEMTRKVIEEPDLVK